MGEHGRWLVSEGGRDALCPGVFEYDAVDRGDDVNPDGFNTHLEDQARPR